ncbi:MAG: hypothetical protein U0X75_12060 [Acidobacteriota bacterium]
MQHSSSQGAVDDSTGSGDFSAQQSPSVTAFSAVVAQCSAAGEVFARTDCPQQNTLLAPLRKIASNTTSNRVTLLCRLVNCCVIVIFSVLRCVFFPIGKL